MSAWPPGPPFSLPSCSALITPSRYHPARVSSSRNEEAACPWCVLVSVGPAWSGRPIGTFCGAEPNNPPQSLTLRQMPAAKLVSPAPGTCVERQHFGAIT